MITKLTVGTVLQPAEEDRLILGYDCADMLTLAALMELECLSEDPTHFSATLVQRITTCPWYAM